MNQDDQITELFLRAVRHCEPATQLRYLETFRELPLSVLLYVAELPEDAHLTALQSSYIGFLAGKGAARDGIVKAFLSAAGFEHVVITGESGDVH